MINEATQETATLYVLDSLDSAEREQFERLMESDGEVRELVRELRENFAELALLAPPLDPPGALRENILAAAARTPQQSAGEDNAVSFAAPPDALPRKASSWNVVIPWAIAACAVLAAVYFAREARDLENLLAAARQRADLAQMKVVTLSSQLNAEYLATVGWDDENQKGILDVRRLPEAEAEKIYQLWVIGGSGESPVSAGVFRLGSDGTARVEFNPVAPVRNAQTFAVSLEKAGGATAPEGPIVLAGSN